MNKKDKYLEIAWKEYNEKLLSFIRANVISPEDAEDILADVYVKLVRQTELSRIPQKLPNWLFRVTRNTMIDFYRTRKSLKALPENLKEDLPEPQAISTFSDCILPIIEALPENYRLPILLSEIHGKKQKEVAEELGLSLSALKTRILRGRKKLKDLMSKRCTFYYDKHGQLIDYKEVRGDEAANLND
jgi:RNA polymerase sigma-70 factor, ECF subfamily